MAFNVTVTPGYTPIAGVEMSAADFLALATPNVSIVGAAGTEDLTDGSVTWPKLAPNLMVLGTAITQLAADDLLAVHDTSGVTLATITVANAVGGLLGAAGAVEAFEAYTGDTIVFRQASNGAAKSMAPARFLEQLINQAPEIEETADADGVAITDASAGAGAKAKLVSLANLLPSKHVAALDVANPTRIQVDTKGRVTGIATTGTGARYTTATGAPISLPVGAGWGNGVDVDTGLGARPGIVQGWLLCNDAGGDAGWAQGEIIPLDWVAFDTAGSTYFNGKYGLVPNGALGVLRVVQPDATGGVRVHHKTTGDDVAFTATKWKLLITAIR